MKRFIPLLLLHIISFLNVNAQNMTIGDSTSHWKIGFNTGVAFQKADVKSRLGYGLGATLEWALIQNSHSAIGMSLRLRYLRSITYGQDFLKSKGIQNNPALNGNYNSETDYASSPGYTYMNYKTKASNIDFEMMLVANRLRMKGILLYGFGGVGFMPFKTYYDLQGSDFSKYDYTTIQGTDKKQVLSQINSIRDKNYETAANGTNKTRWAFAPSFGAGLGFYLSPSIVLGVEHKVTLPNTDALDGQQWNNNNRPTGNHDVHHYTNLFLRIDLGNGGRGRHHYYYNNPNNYSMAALAPDIIVKHPTGSIINNCYADIQLTIKNLMTESDVQVLKDGQVLDPTSYLFNPASGYFSLTMAIEKATGFEIIASNSVGTRSHKVLFNCNPNPVNSTVITTAPPLPIITVTTPIQSPAKSYDCNASIIAQISNIPGKRSIELLQDGQIINPTLYSFNNVTGILSLNMPFQENTRFVITARNITGKATTIVDYFCQPAPVKVIPKPIISIINPNQPYSISPNCLGEILASIRNIESKYNIEVRLNGIVLSSSTYRYNSYTNEFYLTMPIQGANTFAITAFNEAGSTTAYVNIKCEPPIIIPATPKPVIIINNPINNPYISKDCKADISATILYINNKNNIEVRQNGNIINSSLYNYDSHSKIFRLLSNISGISNYTITAVNNTGMASASLSIKCEAAPISTNELPKPVIVITSPSSNPFTTKDCKINLTASIQYIAGKQNLELRLNGQVIPSNLYEYDPISKILSLQYSIKEVSIFSITAVNASGSAMASTTVKCEQEPIVIEKNKPIVTITNPTQNPFIAQDCKATIKATIQFITSKNDIEVRRNEQIISNSLYSYSAATKELVLNTDINEVSVFSIIAINAIGSAEANTTIKCEPKNNNTNIPAPTVTITNPLTNPYVSTDCKAVIKATIANIDSKANIEVKVNGQVINSSLYTYDAISKILTYNINISEVSVVSILAANSVGTASATTSLKCEPKVIEKPRPIVTITSPANNSLAENCRTTIIATIKNIDSKNELVVKQENELINSNLIDFNVNTNIVKVTTTITGTTKFTIIAGNPSGYDSSSVIVRCEIKKPDPVITIISPTDSPVITEECIASAKVLIQNITSKSQIIVMLDNNTLNSDQYNYSTETKTLSFSKSFTGKVSLLIRASNESATIEKTIQFECKPKTVEEKVTICHYPPGNTDNPQTLTIPQSALKAHLEHGDKMGTCEDIKKTQEESETKVTICHYPPGNTNNPQTLTIPQSALKAHLDHGDKMGTCEDIKKAQEESETKVTICHYPPGNTDNPQTLTIPQSALKAHLDHGDKMGTCEDIKKAEELEKQKKDEEDKAKQLEIENQKKDAEDKAKREAEEKAKAEQERIQKEAEDKAKQLEIENQKKDAEEKAKREAEEKAKAEQERIQKEAEDKAKQLEIENQKKDAEEKANQEAEEKAKAEQERIRKEAEQKAKQLELEKQKKDAEEKAKAEQERIRKAEEEKAKQIELENQKKEAEEKENQDKENQEKENQESPQNNH